MHTMPAHGLGFAIPSENEDWKATALTLRKSHRSVKYISDRIHVSEDAIRKFFIKEKAKGKAKKVTKDGFQVYENLRPNLYEPVWGGNQVLTIALMGDTQINSKYTQLTYLHQFYDVCYARGVHDVYHTGDIDEGEKMRPGHQYECYNQGVDDHVDEIVRVYPRREGIRTHFILGNHDASIYKLCGLDLGELIAQRREDMHYLGRDCARINLTPNCVLELRHPWDGTAYALSYKPQKMIAAMESDSKPNILAIGHYHKVEYLFRRNVHALQTGCFQSQTPFTRGRGIETDMGGWIVTIEVDADGHIQRFIPELIPFYKGIADDYKNWDDDRDESKKLF